MNRRIEFIESYRKIGNDYQWSDNHGELVRCKDCKHSDHGTDEEGKRFLKCLGICYGGTTPDWFCAEGERREEE